MLSQYLSDSSPITWLVLLVLSAYFIATFWIFVYRIKILNSRIAIESQSLSMLYMGRSTQSLDNSIFYSYMQRVQTLTPEILQAAVGDTVRSATKGLTQLSIIASTSPFIGLFGTVVGILEAFGKLGSQKSVSLSVVAPAISEALVATAAGIFVAIFAYAFHLLLKRKAYELQSVLQSQADILISKMQSAKRVQRDV